MTRNQAYPSKYMSKEDVMIPVIATIEGAGQEELEGDEGKKTKAVLYFKEPHLKPWIIPNCSWMEIEALYGPESDTWIGKQIEIFADMSVMFGNKRVGGVRCRGLQRGARAPAQPMKRPQTAPAEPPVGPPDDLTPPDDELDGTEIPEEPGGFDGLNDNECVDMTPVLVKNTTLQKEKAWAVILPDKRWCLTTHPGQGALLIQAHKEQKKVRLELVPLEGTSYQRIVNVLSAS